MDTTVTAIHPPHVALDPTGPAMATWQTVLWQTAVILWAVCAFPLKIVWSLLSKVTAVALFLLSPVTLVFSYAWSWVGCGALVGLVAGLFMVLASGVITSALGMRDDTRARRSDYYDELVRPVTPAKTEYSSSGETDWHLLEELPPKRRRRTAGLVAQTIHEEESNDSDL
ncbi:predicted protein [Verticillium alfalfae VaMs.102]|uniref:Predicted protein n=1 Tax=Verticillium alfalfae (strain VaMs.102 / ATCC MYA-4576 / FGSC 10136) TaxID=526221 RepID=C9S8J0_VERA1|nr:predicted protein [Verticillium alfalfae VaMs.102]EEY13951.1 predicted protein [Verticillium alfalfae VaMs.102]